MPADELARTATWWMDRWWDPDAGLLWNPPGAFADVFSGPKQSHLVRETSWYALGLLARRGDGDIARARRALRAVVDLQEDAPGQPWHGTFRRFPEHGAPGAGAVEWRDYDPNWRQFVGTSLALALTQFGDDLPGPLAGRMDDALELAVHAEPPDRVPPSYTNIALLRAWLDVEVGHRRSDRELGERGTELARAVVDRFDEHGTFDEFNSPTYYGVDLFGLGLWRELSRSGVLRQWGARLEAALWREVAASYHAGLRNLAGPYSRAYGMDMASYVALLGLWIWAAAGRRAAPVPNVTTDQFDHSHDFCFAPCIGLVGARVPSDAIVHLTALRWPRLVARDQVSAWVGERILLGGFWPRDETPAHPALGQHHPMTVHWARSDGAVGWLRARGHGSVRAKAEPDQLELTWEDDVWFEAPDGVEAPPPPHGSGHWRLPGLAIEVEPGPGEHRARLRFTAG